jgi:hypothetical protein
MANVKEGIGQVDPNRGLRDRLRHIPPETSVVGVDELEVAVKDLQELARNRLSQVVRTGD